ncbi:hypothetical protein AWB81_05366 [Caballeronia arationis]|uniref:hypothetical protein n=1 Tax=Caballeronia arationis TaxID=1777142 RepID=UPI00074D23E2|nr:hypothetical protein [Caballeronia arationis]SAK96247.1 hypothetical protein AWB81_05366 [Caballeronia arationis]
MTTRYTEMRIAVDNFEGGTLSPAGQSGDWLDVFISFEGDLPVKIPNFAASPRVIVTPVKATKFSGGQLNVATPVCLARDVSTKGFRLAARNADPDFGGSFAFDWVAIEESPGVTGSVPALERGTFPPRYFAPSRESLLGRRTFSDHVYYLLPRELRLLDTKLSSVQLTATDQNVAGPSVPAVGIVDDPFEIDELDLSAHNTDLIAGSCAFNWATFSYSKLFDPTDGNTPDQRIDTGEVAEAWFESSGNAGDWRTWDVVFKSPFAVEPIVLLTANKRADIPVRLNPAVLGVAQAVTSHGFRLAARNSDLSPGLAGFHWIAIGASS